MQKLINSLEIFDKFNLFLGMCVKWVVAALVLLGFYEVVVRYFFNSPTIWGYEMMCMIGTTIAVLAWGYVETSGGHIRVDVFYDMFSRKGQAIIDVVGGLVFGLPVFLVYCTLSARFLVRSWVDGEVLTQSYWYPSQVPIRVIVLVGFVNAFLMFLVSFTRRIIYLITGQQFKGQEYKGEDL